mmetsp:Transcript_18263/g.46737  ORF Transcript_18263/g.46737 Transcript_18263/m.46737 type:complete len:227 (+) Transcript_18263:715-1395(+)
MLLEQPSQPSVLLLGFSGTSLEQIVLALRAVHAEAHLGGAGPGALGLGGLVAGLGALLVQLRRRGAVRIALPLRERVPVRDGLVEQRGDRLPEHRADLCKPLVIHRCEQDLLLDAHGKGAQALDEVRHSWLHESLAPLVVPRDQLRREHLEDRQVVRKQTLRLGRERRVGSGGGGSLRRAALRTGPRACRTSRLDERGERAHIGLARSHRLRDVGLAVAWPAARYA